MPELISFQDSTRHPKSNYIGSGVYFVTVCTRDRHSPLGVISNGEIELTAAGEIVIQTWLELPKRFATLGLDEFVVMPNHIHAILVLHNLGGACPPSWVNASLAEPLLQRSPTLGAIVGTFKAFSASRINRCQSTSGPFWQHNYFEHVVRSGQSLETIRRYVHENPLRWHIDRENPDAASSVA